MQTFLPYTDFQDSALCLDNKRLNSQSKEARQIINALEKLELGEKAGWQHHPATLMWEGHIPALKMYANHILQECVRRGFRMKAEPFRFSLPEHVSVHAVEKLPVMEFVKLITPLPWWWGREEFHSSHRSKLLQKNPAHYGQYDWQEEPGQEYWWPTHQERPHD